VVVCHAITVTNHRFTWCSAVQWCFLILVLAVSYVTQANFISKLFFKLSFWIIWGGTVWKSLLQDKFLFQIMNYRGFQHNQVNLHKLFFLGMQVRNIAKFEITEFQIKQVLVNSAYFCFLLFKYVCNVMLRIFYCIYSRYFSFFLFIHVCNAMLSIHVTINCIHSRLNVCIIVIFPSTAAFA
jgi:hypothetical protein